MRTQVQVAPHLLIIEHVLSREIEGYNVETQAALAARELIGNGVKAPYQVATAWFIYDRREYAASLKAAAKEVGVIGDDDSSEERGAAGADRLPLFPD